MASGATAGDEEFGRTKRQHGRARLDLRTEFSDLQDLVKRMRSPVEPSMDRAQINPDIRCEPGQCRKSSLRSGVRGPLPPAKSAAGKEAEVAGGW